MKTSLNMGGTSWLKEERYETGYFGIPGKNGGRTHVVKFTAGDTTRKPLCGEKIHPDAKFQWCAQGLYLPYVECLRCKERAERLFIQANEKVLNIKRVIVDWNSR